MALDNVPLNTAAELQRHFEVHNQWVQSYRAQKLSRLKQMLFQGARKILFFLLGAVIVTLAITHRNELDALVGQTASRALAHVQTRTVTTETLRQNTANYEKEVDEASK